MKKVAFDIEVYPNYSLFAFENISSNKKQYYEIKGGSNILSVDACKSINYIFKNCSCFGFNSKNYDIPLILFALDGYTAQEIFQLSKKIIVEGIPAFKLLRDYNKRINNSWNHHDIIDVVGGIKTSLKLYGARIHAPKLQDLPYNPLIELTEEQMVNVRNYCFNDLHLTALLFEKIRSKYNLRLSLSATYKMDLRSSSDQAIAETIIRKLVGVNSSVDEKSLETTFRYNIPSYITSNNDSIIRLLNNLQSLKFNLDPKNLRLITPESLSSCEIEINNKLYEVGVGGLHSKEKKLVIIPEDNYKIINYDVVSYYPNIIKNLKLKPARLNDNFNNVYNKLLEDRVIAKNKGDKVTSETLKIVINGTFGKFNNKYSTMFSPKLLLQVTLTGQLSLLMLIEMLEKANISVCSANTDGVMVYTNDELKANAIVDEWCNLTNFSIEKNYFDRYYARDVNNYVAIVGDNFKTKGAYSYSGLQKNPCGDICVEAVLKYLKDNIPLEKTIFPCNDITKFIFARTVKGGAVFRGELLGKVVRWIYVNEGDIITYKESGNKVAKANNCKPIMNLDKYDKPFLEIDYGKYVAIARDLLDDIGYWDI